LQEHVNERTIALQVNTAKMTAREFRKLIEVYLRHRKEQKRNKSYTGIKGGRTTLEKLSKKYDGLKNIEISENNIKDFEKTAKKYNLEYALKKDDKTNPSTYFVFFKGKDLDVIDFAFREYLKSSIDKKEEKRPSLRETIKEMIKIANNLNKEKVRNKDKEQSL
jgi:outer membrane lipoprotein-sorting protein